MSKMPTLGPMKRAGKAEGNHAINEKNKKKWQNTASVNIFHRFHRLC